jgi:hypothetical protein
MSRLSDARNMTRSMIAPPVNDWLHYISCYVARQTVLTGHRSKSASTARHLGIEVGDALGMAEKTQAGDLDGNRP